MAFYLSEEEQEEKDDEIDEDNKMFSREEKRAFALERRDESVKEEVVSEIFDVWYKREKIIVTGIDAMYYELICSSAVPIPVSENIEYVEILLRAKTERKYYERRPWFRVTAHGVYIGGLIAKNVLSCNNLSQELLDKLHSITYFHQEKYIAFCNKAAFWIYSSTTFREARERIARAEVMDYVQKNKHLFRNKERKTIQKHIHQLVFDLSDDTFAELYVLFDMSFKLFECKNRIFDFFSIKMFCLQVGFHFVNKTAICWHCYKVVPDDELMVLQKTSSTEKVDYSTECSLNMTCKTCFFMKILSK